MQKNRAKLKKTGTLHKFTWYLIEITHKIADFLWLFLVPMTHGPWLFLPRLRRKRIVQPGARDQHMVKLWCMEYSFLFIYFFLHVFPFFQFFFIFFTLFFFCFFHFLFFMCFFIFFHFLNLLSFFFIFFHFFKISREIHKIHANNWNIHMEHSEDVGLELCVKLVMLADCSTL